MEVEKKEVEKHSRPRLIEMAPPARLAVVVDEYECSDEAGSSEEEDDDLSLIHISEPTRLRRISYAVFCLKKKTLSAKTRR